MANKRKIIQWKDKRHSAYEREKEAYFEWKLLSPPPFFLSVAFSSSSVLSLALVCRLQCLKRWYFHFTSSRIVVFFLCFLGKKEKKKHRRRKLKAMITVDWNTEISRWTTLTHSLNIHHTFCDCRSGNSRSFTELQDCVPIDWWNDEGRSGNGVWVIKIDKIFFFLLCHFLCRMNVLMCGLLYIARKYESKPPFLSFCTDIAAKRNPSGLFNFEMRNKFFNSDAKNFCLTHCSSFVLESFIVFFSWFVRFLLSTRFLFLHSLAAAAFIWLFWSSFSVWIYIIPKLNLKNRERNGAFFAATQSQI